LFYGTSVSSVSGEQLILMKIVSCPLIGSQLWALEGFFHGGNSGTLQRGQKVFLSRAGQQWYSAILPIRDYNKNIFSTDNLIRKYQNQGSKFPCHLFRRPFSQMLQVALRCAAKYSH